MEIARLSWLGGLYVADKKVIIPQYVLQACLLNASKKFNACLTQLLWEPVSAQAADAVMVGDAATARDGGFHGATPAIPVCFGHIAFAVGPHDKREIQVRA